MADRVVTVRFKAEMQGLKQAMQDARKESEKTAYQFDKDGKKIEGTSGKLVRHAELNKRAWTAAGTAVAAFGAAGLLALTGAAKAAMDWETAWTGVVKTVDGTTDQMIVLEDQLREMARTLPATHQEIAAVAEAAGQLGVRTEDVAGFTKVMIDLGNTTNLTADEAATSIAQLMNVMQSAPGDVDNLGAAIVALGNNGASTERDIVQMAQRIGASGKLIGLSEGEVLGLSNALASVGIDAEAGGSAVSNILIDIAKATKTGSKELTTWAQVAGKSVDEFRAAWESDPAAALDDIIQGLGRMNAAGEDVFSTLDALGQSDVRVTRALLSMATSGSLLADSLELGNKALKDNTALIEEASKRYDTTASKVEVAKNSLNDAAITIGEDLLPVLAGLAEGVAGVANAFSDLPAPVQSAVGALGGLVSVVAILGGGLLIVLPRLAATVAAFKTLKTDLPRVANGLSAVSKAAGPVALAMAAMAAGGAVERWSVATVEGAGVATQALLDLADGATIADTALNKVIVGGGGFKEWLTGNDLTDVADAFGTLAAPSVAQGIDNVASSILTLGQSTSASRMQAQEFFKSVDTGLASLVQSGAPDKARDALAQIAKEAGTTQDKVMAFLPQYADALADVDTQNKLTTDSTKEQAAATQQSAEVAEAAAKALNDWRNAARSADSSFINLNDAYQSVIDKNTEIAQSTADATKSAKDSWEDYYDGQKVSLKDYIKALKEQVAAQTEWEDNLKGLSKRVNSKLTGSELDNANAMLAELATQGPQSAPLVEALSGATDHQLKVIVDQWSKGGESAADDFVARFEALSAPVVTPTLNLSPATTQYNDWVKRLGAVQPAVPVKSGSPFMYARAGGGPVYGPGSTTSDSILARLSNREYVQTAKAHDFWGTRAMDAINRRDVGAVMAAISAKGFAQGGAVNVGSSPQVITVPVSSTHTQSAPVVIQHASFASPGDAGLAALKRLNKQSGDW